MGRSRRTPPARRACTWDFGTQGTLGKIVNSKKERYTTMPDSADRPDLRASADLPDLHHDPGVEDDHYQVAEEAQPKLDAAGIVGHVREQEQEQVAVQPHLAVVGQEQDDHDREAGAARPAGSRSPAEKREQEEPTHDPTPLATSFVLRNWDGGAYVEVVPLPAMSMLDRRQGGGRRGEIRGFTAASRRRLIEALFKLREDALAAGIFATMTVSDLVSVSEIKESWGRFRKRLLRAHPGVGGYWRLEFQSNGLPHLHVLVLGLSNPDDNLSTLRSWLRAQWIESLGFADSPALNNLVRADLVQDTQRVRWYLAKVTSPHAMTYASNVGRCWSKFGRVRSFEGVVRSTLLTSRQAAQVRRLLDGIKLSHARRHPNLRLRGQKIARARRRRWDRYAFRIFGRVDVERFLAESE